MTLRKIALLGQPVLLRKACPVSDPTDPRVQSLIADMRETLADARGLGLAAPQVYAGERIILAHVPAPDDAVDRGAAPLVLVNPRLEPLGGERTIAVEGCLSIPGLRGLVPRFRRVALEALDERGHPVRRQATGLFARILQHEVDHLDGILLLHRLQAPDHLAFESELAALIEHLADENATVSPKADGETARGRPPEPHG